MKRAMVLLAWVAGILVVGNASLVALMVFRVGVTRPTVYELHSGHGGWLQIRYEDPSCPSSSTRGVFQTIRVAADGRGCTSDSLPRGWHYQRATYLEADGSRRAAPPVWPLGDSDQRKLVLLIALLEESSQGMPFGSEGVQAGIGLALSGGGFRATLFHCGALWRLNELGLLPRFDRVSSVSGGSITAGVLAVRWGTLQFSSGVATNLVPAVIEPLPAFRPLNVDGPAIGQVPAGPRGEILNLETVQK